MSSDPWTARVLRRGEVTGLTAGLARSTDDLRAVGGLPKGDHLAMLVARSTVAHAWISGIDASGRSRCRAQSPERASRGPSRPTRSQAATRSRSRMAPLRRRSGRARDPARRQRGGSPRSRHLRRPARHARRLGSDARWWEAAQPRDHRCRRAIGRRRERAHMGCGSLVARSQHHDDYRSRRGRRGPGRRVEHPGPPCHLVRDGRPRRGRPAARHELRELRRSALLAGAHVAAHRSDAARCAPPGLRRGRAVTIERSP